MNKIYKVLRHQANSSSFELGTYSSCEKAEEAIQWVVNNSRPFVPAKYVATEFYEIEEYPIDLLPSDRKCKSKTRNLNFDYEGNFISEHIIIDDECRHLYFGQIDCGQKLEVFETDRGLINVWDVETQGQVINAALYLIPFDSYRTNERNGTFEPYVAYNDKSSLSDEQIRAVMNFLKGPCRNKRFRTNWDYALLNWSYFVFDNSHAYAELINLQEKYKFPDTEQLIRNSKKPYKSLL